MPETSINSETSGNMSLPKSNPQVLSFLKQRRSNLAKLMRGPGPDDAQIQDILEIAARVPDHRKLTPWRFVLFQGKAREDFGQHIGAAFTRENPNLPVDRAVFEAARMTRAPLVIAVISSPKDCPRGTPKWEQELSAGAVCFNLCLAAQSHGFAAQWLTEWYAFNDAVDTALGVKDGERVAGYMYIGTTDTPPAARARPELADITAHWS